MNISTNGINLIKSFESCSLKACKAVSTEKYYTIGWGHYGADVSKNQTITLAQADALFLKDIKQFVTAVEGYNLVYNFNQNQFDALCSFTYNCGIGNLNKLVKNGSRSKADISTAMLAYNKSGGKVLKGLTTRRQKEQALFNKAVASTKKTNDQIANEVIAGKWGSGATRKAKLTAAGYDYAAIQKLVNKKLGG